MDKLFSLKWLSSHKKTLLVLGLFVLLTAIKFVNINGGFVPGEPDERTHAEVIRNLHTFSYPIFDSRYFFYSPPLFFYLGYVVSLFTGSYFLPGRILSIGASFLLALVLYYYLKRKVKSIVALITVCLFLILPMTVFYSRLGLLEMLVTLLSFSFLVVFETGWMKKSYFLLVLSGVLLGLGLLTKYSVLAFSAVPFLVFGTGFLFSRPKINRKYLSSYLFPRIIYLVLIFMIVLIVCLPVLFWLFKINPFEFKSQLKYTLGLGSRRLEFGIVKDYILSFPYLFTYPITFFALFGLMRSLKNWRDNLVILFAYFILTFSLIKVSLYSPRYLVIFIPLITVFVANGLEGIRLFFNKLKISALVSWVGVAALLFTIIPTSLLAFNSGYHNLFEQTATYVKENNTNNDWVLTNYWPTAFVNTIGYKMTWLSNDLTDSQAFSWLTGSNEIQQSSAEVAFTQGAYVLVEDLYSPSISMRESRQDPLNYLKNNYQPQVVFKDTSPNWPYYSQNNNQSAVYHLGK